MRLYAIPIMRNRWAYYCQTSHIPTTRLAKFVDWSSNKWEHLGEADKDSWKMKLFVKGNSIMNQLDYQEWFLKSIPSSDELKEPLSKVIVHHPSILHEIDLKTDLDVMVKERIPYHKKYMYYSAYWVPVSCTFVLVPLIPNIPLAYNLFRLYSHYKAYKGAQHLEYVMDNKKVGYEQDNRLITDRLCVSEDIVFPKEVKEAFDRSNKPNLMSYLTQDIEGVIKMSDIHNISKTLNVPRLETELNRARIQQLKKIAYDRYNSV